MDINQLTSRQFKQLPLVIEGESKEIRYCGKGEVIIRLKPTIYSFTHNRTGVIKGTDHLRLQAIQKLIPCLKAAGIDHTYIEVNDRWVKSKLVLQPITLNNRAPFRPTDMQQKDIEKLPIAPPIEVVVKKVHSGTPKHRYYKMDEIPTRDGRFTKVDSPYPTPIVRFDWRNPMYDANGNRLADEVMSETMADWYIDVETAKQTAANAFNALDIHMQTKGLNLWDICFFIAADGKTMFGEISPDCMRVRSDDSTPLDKDVWRSGGSSANVKQKWQAFADRLKV
jgi:phosphoribosylaminoimidazole-succinocarboxamide synthase